MTDTKPLVSYLAIRLSSSYQEHLLKLPGKHWDSRVSIQYPVDYTYNKSLVFFLATKKECGSKHFLLSHCLPPNRVGGTAHPAIAQPSNFYFTILDISKKQLNKQDLLLFTCTIKGLIENQK